MMEIVDDEILSLIADYCKGELSSDRAVILKNWLNDDPNNQKVLVAYRQLYYDTQSYGFLSQDSKELARLRISKAIKQHKIRRIIFRTSYAAAFLVAASFSFYFFHVHDLRARLSEPSSSAISSVKTGGRKAILTLGNGSVVSLNDHCQQNISEMDGTLICKDASNNLKYAASGSNQERLIFNRIQIPRGGEYSLTLSDGTKVWLNAESELRFPVKFNSDRRDVFLVGEAYFEVAHNRRSPFTVHVNDVKVKVLGTKFNVSAYADQNSITATLVDGSVAVNCSNNSKTLKPGLQSKILKGSDDIEIHSVDTQLYTSWVDGVFKFENMELQDIMVQLSRWYNVRFVFTQEKFKHIRFKGAIKRSKSFEFALNIIERVSDVEFQMRDNCIFIGRPNS